MTTTPTTATPTRCADELELIMRDLATTGRSCAADRALRLAHAAFDARVEAHDALQAQRRDAKKLQTQVRKQAKRELVDDIRARFWAARR